MRSAWGIDDGQVSKSRIPGRGFKAITAMTSGERDKLRASMIHAPGRRSSHWSARQDPQLRDVKSTMKDNNLMRMRIAGDTNIRRPTKGVVDVKTTAHGATAAIYGPKKGPQRGVYLLRGPKGGGKKIREHELLHTKNRSSWRLAQIENDAGKLAREEARVDTLSGTHKMLHLTSGMRSHTQVNRAQAKMLPRLEREAAASGEKSWGSSGIFMSPVEQARNSKSFVDVQDKIRPQAKREARRAQYTASGIRNGAQGAAVGTMTGGAIAWDERKHPRKSGKFVSKSFPDAADMHVLAPLGRKRKGRLRRKK